DGEQSAVLVLRDLHELILNQLQRLVRRDPRQRRRDLIHQVGDREEAGERDQEQQRREQREKEIVRELRGEAEAGVGEARRVSAFKEVVPGKWNPERLQHQRTRARPEKPVPTVDVNAGGSLAGNESADASCTRSSRRQPLRSQSASNRRRASDRSPSPV